MYIKKFNNHINFGLLFFGIFLLGNYTNLLPEFIKGFCVTASFILMFIGVYSEKHSISKLKIHKNMLFRRVLTKFQNR